MIHNNFASLLRRIRGSKNRKRRQRASFRFELLRLEDRRMMSVAPHAIPSTNQVVDLSTIFWNGGAPLNTVTGVPGLMSPDAEGAGKTITITNYGTETIYPFLRSSNSGKDPNDANKNTDGGGFYDPQDLQTHDVGSTHIGYEFRQYVGYSLPDGSKNLGLPSGASITFEVPLVLWDGDNISLATDDKYLTTPKGQPGATLFGYDTSAKISIATSSQTINGSVWLQKSANYPTGASPLVMFYFSQPDATVADDAPSQPAEVTFRDPYLKHFINDPFQTFALINYDVTNVNKLAAPGSMEASAVPITTGSVKDGDLKDYPPPEDFGWHGSDKNLTAFNAPLVDFVKNQGDASIGAYFGAQKQGWPTFYNPDKDEINIPSGSDLFDLSPLDVNGTVVHTSNFDINRWILSTSGGGAIQASAGSAGAPTVNNNQASIPLSLGVNERPVFVQDIASMEASGQKIYLTTSTDLSNLLGTLNHYDPSSPVTAFSLTPGKGGSGYSNQTFVRITPVNGHGKGAVADLGGGHIVNGVIQSIGLKNGGSGYTAPPKIEIVDPSGKGHGAQATASIGGGTAKVTIADGKTLPTGSVTWVFSRKATDYAATAITNLWYSWAKYYAGQFTGAPPTPTSGNLVFKDINTGGPGNTLTNQIKLASIPSTPLAVGMTVTAPAGIPAGTTILKIVGDTIYLSQIPDANTPMTQVYTFGNPQEFPIDAVSALYTTPYTLSFDAAATPGAVRFASSVYEAMQVQLLRLQQTPADRSKYLPLTMDVVADVIKFNANLPTHTAAWGPTLVGEARDLVKSILRGVYDFFAVPDQTKWYPDPGEAPKGLTSGQKFNPFNLDPYVWFVHKIENLDGYAFSVDDDVANPAASGGGINAPTHSPSNLQLGFAGIKPTGTTAPLKNAPPLGNLKEWFPTTKWGSIETMAKIGVWQGAQNDPFNGYSAITFTATQQDPDVLRTLNKIITPGPGQIGAFISAPGHIVPGTTLIFFPAGVTDPTKPTIILSQKAISTGDMSIPITINAAQKKLPTVALKNPSFAAPPQTSPPFHTINPKDPDTFGSDTIFWRFTGTAGIAGKGSIYTKNNPAPAGGQVGFIQNQGSISQSVMLAPNTAYALSFLVSQRVLDDGSMNSQTLRVRIGTKVIGEFEPTQTKDGTYLLFTSDAFTVNTAGMYNIVIEGTNTKGGNNTALIDQVILTGGKESS